MKIHEHHLLNQWKSIKIHPWKSMNIHIFSGPATFPPGSTLSAGHDSPGGGQGEQRPARGRGHAEEAGEAHQSRGLFQRQGAVEFLQRKTMGKP